MTQTPKTRTRTNHLAPVRPISAPTNEYWLEMTERTDGNYALLEARADGIEGINEYDFDGDVACFEASPSGFRDLVYDQIQTEYGEQPVRALFGEQYTEADDFEEAKQEMEEPREVAADGGQPESRDKMKDVDHESPLDGVQKTLERGG